MTPVAAADVEAEETATDSISAYGPARMTATGAPPLNDADMIFLAGLGHGSGAARMRLSSTEASERTCPRSVLAFAQVLNGLRLEAAIGRPNQQ